MKKSLLLLLVFCLVLAVQAGHPPKTNVLRKKPQKIINGTPVTLPYQALLSTDPKNLTGGYHAGGVLISPNCILTAKHVINGGGSALKAFVGIGSRNDANTPLGIAGNVTNGQTDLGLIFLSSPIANASPIKLASENNSSWWGANQSLQVSGFGIASANTTNVSNSCLRTSVTTSATIFDSNMIICEGAPTNSTNDACQGDSGRPLIKSGNNVLTGIVSTDLYGGVIPTSLGAANNCGKGGRYVKVSKYLGWIVGAIFAQDAASVPERICAGQSVTFTNLPIVPDGCTFTWAATPSNLFSSTQTSNNGTTFTASGVGGLATVTLTFKAPGLADKIVEKKLWVGLPGPIAITTDGTFSIFGNNASVCKTFGYSMVASMAPSDGFSQVTEYTWTGGWGNNNAFFTPSTSSSGIAQDKISFGNNNTGTFPFYVTSENACGTSSRILFVSVNSCGFRVFPNPASTLLTIDYEIPDKLESIPKKIELVEEKSLKKVKQVLNNGQLKKNEIDVSDLPRGIYYLKLCYGNEKKSDDNIKIILQ